MDELQHSAAPSASSSDPARNPYASPKQPDPDPLPEPTRRSRPMLESLSPACRAVFGIDLAFCTIHGLILACLLLLVLFKFPAEGLVVSKWYIVWLVGSILNFACGFIGDLMLLSAIPAGRWYAWLSVPTTFVANFIPLIVSAHPTALSGPPVFQTVAFGFGAIYRFVFSVIFTAMYITALVECSRRPRADKPAYLWSDLMK